MSQFSFRVDPKNIGSVGFPETRFFFGLIDKGKLFSRQNAMQNFLIHHVASSSKSHDQSHDQHFLSM